MLQSTLFDTVPNGPKSVVLEDRNTTAILLNVSGPEIESVFDSYLVCVDEQHSTLSNCSHDASMVVPSVASLIVISGLTAGTTYIIQLYTSSNNVPSTVAACTRETTCKCFSQDVS